MRVYKRRAVVRESLEHHPKSASDALGATLRHHGDLDIASGTFINSSSSLIMRETGVADLKIPFT